MRFTLCFSALVLGAAVGTFDPRTAEGCIADLSRSRISDLVCCGCSNNEDFSNDKVTNGKGGSLTVTVVGDGDDYDGFSYPHGQSVLIHDGNNYTFVTIGDRTSHCDPDATYGVDVYVTGHGLCFDDDVPYDYGGDNDCCP